MACTFGIFAAFLLKKVNFNLLTKYLFIKQGKYARFRITLTVKDNVTDNQSFKKIAYLKYLIKNRTFQASTDSAILMRRNYLFFVKKYLLIIAYQF